MPWCPKCKNEYVEGVSVCSDCGTKLVDSLDEGNGKSSSTGNYIPILYGPKENITGILEAVRNAGVASAELRDMPSEDSDEKLYELYVDEADKDKTITTVKLMMKAKEELEEMEARRKLSREKAPERYEAYVSAEEKAKEMRNSAWMLVIIAVIGFIVIILMITHVLPFGFGTGGGAIFCYSVLGGFFALLFVSGILSFRSGMRVSVKSADENDLTDKAKSWMNDNFTKDSLANIAKNAEDDNQLYFIRAEYMKRKLMTEFPDLKENLADTLIEDKYGELYD